MNQLAWRITNKTLITAPKKAYPYTYSNNTNESVKIYNTVFSYYYISEKIHTKCSYFLSKAYHPSAYIQIAASKPMVSKLLF